MNDVFPDPFGPIIPRISPFSMERAISWTAVTPPNFFHSLSVSRRAIFVLILESGGPKESLGSEEENKNHDQTDDEKTILGHGSEKLDGHGHHRDPQKGRCEISHAPDDHHDDHETGFLEPEIGRRDGRLIHGKVTAGDSRVKGPDAERSGSCTWGY